jgi:hypothetical protein
MKTATKIATTTLTAALLLVAAPAKADNTSLLTLGGGPTVGLSHVVPVTGGSENSVVSELNFRLKLLKVLGFDFNYNMTGEREVGHGEVYSSQMRASALLYVLPTDIISLYLAAGAGASSISDLASDTFNDKSYHGGGGMEIFVGDHMALSAEFLMLVPEIDKVVVSQKPLRLDDSGSMDMGSIDGPSMKDYVSADNFQVSFGLKYFF